MPDNPGDLDRLIGAHRREVYSLLVVITRNPVIAEDLTQEVFLVALRKGMEPGPNTRFWLREVARRLAMNELRKKRPQSLTGDLLENTVDNQSPTAVEEAAPSFEDELTALRQCLAELPEADQRILAARYRANQPLEAMAKNVEQSVGYLKQRFFRLRRLLAGCIKRRMGGKEMARAEHAF